MSLASKADARCYAEQSASEGKTLVKYFFVGDIPHLAMISVHT